MSSRIKITLPEHIAEALDELAEQKASPSRVSPAGWSVRAFPGPPAATRVCWRSRAPRGRRGLSHMAGTASGASGCGARSSR